METGRDLLRGVTVPLVTPMDAPGRPNAAAGAGLVAAVHAAGADALMLLGSNGEGPLLPTRLLGEVTSQLASTWRGLGGGRPLLVNITAAGTAEALDRAEATLPARPDAYVLSPPFYFHHRDDEIIAHYAACADLGVPVIAYHIPRYSNPITGPVFDALLGMGHVVGIKDSGGDLAGLRRMVVAARQHRPGFGVGQGAEGALLAGLRAGADGIVPGIANLAPGPAVALYRAWRQGQPDRNQGDLDRPDHRHRCADTPVRGIGSAGQDTPDQRQDTPDHWQDIVDQLGGVHRVRPGVPAVKEVLAWRGLCPRHVAPPLLPCSDRERAALRSYLEPYRNHLIGEEAT